MLYLLQQLNDAIIIYDCIFVTEASISTYHSILKKMVAVVEVLNNQISMQLFQVWFSFCACLWPSWVIFAMNGIYNIHHLRCLKISREFSVNFEHSIKINCRYLDKFQLNTTVCKTLRCGNDSVSTELLTKLNRTLSWTFKLNSFG